MKMTLLLRKRSLAALMASTILVFSMFIGIAGIPLAPTTSPWAFPFMPTDQPETFYTGKPDFGSSTDQVDPLANIHSNLHRWLKTGIAPENIRSYDGAVSILLGVQPDGDLNALAEYMDIKNVFNLGAGYMVQGFVNHPKNLFAIDNMAFTGVIMGDQMIDYTDEPGGEEPVVSQYLVQDIIENDLVQLHYPGLDGAGVTIGVCDTGVDFGHTDLVPALAREGGFPTSFDPGGMGIALTSFALPSVGGYLLTEGLDFQMWVGDFGGIRMSNSTYGVYAEDMFVGGFGGITSMSGFYKVGMALAVGSTVARNFFVYIIVDSVTPFVYDTVYIDWETSWAITADYNGISTSVAADWDFTNNLPHKWGDGTEVLAADLDGDTYNDYSMGSFAWVYDIFNLLTGDIFGGIDAQGRGFSYMFDEGGHGTSVAGSAAGRGIQMMDLYGNGTLYNTPGVASGAEIMALKIFTFGDYISSWFWGAGYHPSIYPYDMWYLWSYTGAHQCQILSNSWGYTNQLFTAPYNFIWGCDWASYTVDFLSTGGLEDWNDYAGPPHWAPTFVISSGNAGPGYGTSGSPSGATAIMVGASTTTHYAQPTYNNDSSLGPQPYDQIADFSSNGPKPQSAPTPDLVAPGAWSFDIAPLHSSMGNGSEAWTTFGGTSQAAPMTAGVLALCYQVYGAPGEAGPSRYGGFYKSLLKASADNIDQPGLRQGAGRLNAYKAVTMTIGLPFDAYGNPMNYMFSDYTFANWAIPHDPATWSRSWYMNMYYGAAIGVPQFYGDSYYHPGVSGFSGAPNVTWMDAGFTTHSMKAGDTKNIQVTAGLAGGMAEIGAMDAEWFTLLNESTQTFTSTSVYTTYPLFATGHFDKAFQAQFMSADYAVIHLAYDPAQFEAIYALAGQSNYVFLHDWNDTNANGIIDLQSSTSVGEVRRVMFDYAATPVHQIHVGNPGAHWNGNRNATIYYHDVGNELFLWRSLDVTVTIRLYNRVDWNWFSFTWLGPQTWNIQVNVPVSATPGFYSGFVTETTAGYTEYFPVVVRVDGEVGPGDSLTWGGTDGHPYDNGAITGGLDWDGRRPSGEWRWYMVDVADIDVGDNFTSWVMTNVTWSDPNTVIDVYILMGGYGVNGYLGGNVISDTEYVTGGRWDGTPSWPMQNVLFTDFTWDPGSCSDRGYFIIGLHVSRYGGMYVPENFTITVTPVNNATLMGFQSIPGSTGMLNATSHGNAAITENSTWSGPNVMFEASWSPLSVPGFPNLAIRQTRIELVSGVEQEHYGTITEGFVGGWFPDLNPREGYDYVELLAGQEVYVEVEFGTWTAGEGSTLTHTGSDDIDVFVWAPDVPHTYANSLTGSVTASGNNPEIGSFIAPVSGEYTIGLDWYSGAQPMGWRCYVLASQATGLTEDGLSAEIDTSITDTNAAYTIRAVLITGTLLDTDPGFARYEVKNVTVTNFFVPTVQLTYPNGGEVVGPGPVNITWTASDQNTDETLGFSVEVSNDTGTTWKVVVYGTTLHQATWDPQSPFYGLPAGNQFLVRINCTDGRYTVFDESDAVFTVQGPVAPVYLPLELITVVAVAVIVIVILVITCILKRRQSAAK